MNNEHRTVFLTVWDKHCHQKTLSSFEKDVLEVMLQYPQYLGNLDESASYASMEDNPFFVMGLHLAMNDQLRTDRPLGIRLLYQKACQKQGKLQAQANILAVLKQFILSSYASAQVPCDQEYLKMLRKCCQVE